MQQHQMTINLSQNFSVFVSLKGFLKEAIISKKGRILKYFLQDLDFSETACVIPDFIISLDRLCTVLIIAAATQIKVNM